MKPPKKIDGLDVVLFAENNDLVEYKDNIDLFVDNTRISESEYLAICKEVLGQKNILLVFCDKQLSIKGIIKLDSVEQGFDIAENSYKGISANWVENKIIVKSEEKSAYEINECSFCDKPSRDVERLYGSQRSLICNECIEYFSALLKTDSGG